MNIKTYKDFQGLSLEEVGRYFLSRFLGLFDKLVFAISGVAFVLATIFMFRGDIPWYGWLITVGLCISIRETVKIILAAFSVKGNISINNNGDSGAK